MTDDRRIETLVRQEAPGLLAYFVRRVDVREDAADLLGETLLVVWRRARALPADGEGARRWMYGVARRVLATHRRGRRRRVALAERMRSELAIITEVDPVIEEVRTAVRGLPLADRELIGLVHWEGFSLSDAASILGIRAGTARMRYARARERLTARLVQAATTSPTAQRRP